MNKDGDNFVPPSFEDFTVVGGPNTSVSNSWINGERTYSKTYSYFLAPKSEEISPLNKLLLKLKVKPIKTFPVTITVTAAVDRPNDPNDPEHCFRKHSFSR